MLAKALMTFNAFNITAHQGQIIEISDPNIFLDLVQAHLWNKSIDSRKTTENACKHACDSHFKRITFNYPKYYPLI